MSTNYEKELEQMLHSKPIKALLIAISIVLTEMQRGWMAV